MPDSEKTANRDTVEEAVKTQGWAAYFVSEEVKSDISYMANYSQRMFRYADRPDMALYGIGSICMAASGTALPLLDLIFGQFVNTFNDFAIGNIPVSHFRSEIAQARYDKL